jgi:hypothetical protein
MVRLCKLLDIQPLNRWRRFNGLFRRYREKEDVPVRDWRSRAWLMSDPDTGSVILAVWRSGKSSHVHLILTVRRLVTAKFLIATRAACVPPLQDLPLARSQGEGDLPAASRHHHPKLTPKPQHGR